MLNTIYQQMWGKRWASQKTCTISRFDVGLDTCRTMDATLNPELLGQTAEVNSDANQTIWVSPTPVDGDAVNNHEWTYTCLFNIDQVMEAIRASANYPNTTRHVIVVREDYAWLLETLNQSEGSFVVTGQPGIGP